MITVMDPSHEKTAMLPPAPRRKPDDMRKQALSGLLAAAGPGVAGLTRSVLEASAAAVQPHIIRAGGLKTGSQPDSPEAGPAPAHWNTYWDECRTLDLPDRGGSFNVYMAGTQGPILFTVHGAGCTGLTWSLVASALKEKYRIVAPDLRGHGLTTATPENDYGNQTLSADLVAIWHALFPPVPPAAPDQPPKGDPRATVLVGHSMGGAVVVWTAAGKAIPSLAGCVVVDVVEGTAIAALPHMMGVIAARPARFPTPSAAVSWAMRTGMSRNRAAAAVSLPSQLVPTNAAPAVRAALPPVPLFAQGNGTPATPADTAAVGVAVAGQPVHPSLMSDDAAIQEGEEEGEEEGGDEGKGDHQGRLGASSSARVQDASVPAASSPPPAPGQSAEAAEPSAVNASNSGAASSQQNGAPGWMWRTSLAATQPYWQEWYTGLSDTFLTLPMPKMLLLAGTDRLDKPLTIGQMQGKFQLVVLPTAGHAIQEDDSSATSHALDLFVQRQRIGQPPLAVPRAPVGLRPVLPLVAGQLHKPQ